MKKICLVVGNTLPVPAVMGGAVEELITMLLDQNEIEQKAEFIIFSRENKKAEREAKKYKYSRIIYIPDDTVLDKVNNRIRRYASSVLKPGTLLDSGYYRKIYHILRNIKCDAIAHRFLFIIRRAGLNDRTDQNFQKSATYGINHYCDQNSDKGNR